MIRLAAFALPLAFLAGCSLPPGALDALMRDLVEAQTRAAALPVSAPEAAPMPTPAPPSVRPLATETAAPSASEPMAIEPPAPDLPPRRAEAAPESPQREKRTSVTATGESSSAKASRMSDSARAASMPPEPAPITGKANERSPNRSASRKAERTEP